MAENWKGRQSGEVLNWASSPTTTTITTTTAWTPGTSSKPAFKIVADDSKPILRDPLSTSDPIETEQILLQPPPFNPPRNSSNSGCTAIPRAERASYHKQGFQNNEGIQLHSGSPTKTLPPLEECLNSRKWRKVLDGFRSSCGYGTSSDMYHLISKMTSKKQHGAQYVTVETYNNLINAFRKCGMLDYCSSVLEIMKSNFCKPNNFTYNLLMGAYAEAHLWEKADTLFTEIQHQNLKSVSMAFNLLISAYGKAGSFERMEKLFKYMLREGCRPDTCTYNAMISVYGKASKFSKMEAAFADMRASGITPNIVTWTCLADAYRKGNLEEKVDAALQGLFESGFKLDGKAYGLVIDIYGRRKNYAKIEACCEDMIQAGVKPDLITWTCILDGYGRAGLHDKIDLISSHILAKFKPDVPFCLVLLNAYRTTGCLSKMDEVFQMLKELKPATAELLKAYNIVIDAYGSAKLILKMEKTLEEMEDTGLQPDVITSTALIGAYSKAKMLKRMESTFLCMQVACCKPDEFIYSVLIDGYGNLGMVEMAERALADMIKAGYKPNVKELTSILDAYKNAKMYRNLVERFSQLLVSGLRPDHQTMAVFFSALKDCNSPEIASDLMECVRSCDSSGVVMRLLEEKTEDGRLWTEVKELMQRLQRKGGNVEAVFCDSLVDTLWFHGLRQRASKLLALACEMGILSRLESCHGNRLVLDLHMLSVNVAEVALMVWLSGFKAEHNNMQDCGYEWVTIVTGWGRSSRVCGDSPVRKGVTELLTRMGSPFHCDEKNIGRLTASAHMFRQWIKQAQVADS